MSLRFTVLASGSSGNASLIEVDGFGLLLDAGLGPRILAGRLRQIGLSWAHVHAALLTHTHSDHWSDRTFTQFARQGIPLYCHSHHRSELGQFSTAVADLEAGNLIRTYRSRIAFCIANKIQCQPLPIRHDKYATFGFRFEVADTSSNLHCAIGYATDLGSWDATLAESLANVDVLALEFNHDVHLERASGRTARLIARVCGDDGHLSNEQAAELLRDIIGRSRAGRLRHVIQLHLSRDCNRPSLAVKAAHAVLAEHPTPIGLHTASQFAPTRPLVIEPRETNGFVRKRWVTPLLFPDMED
jgi:phosphoribosyl 1,2-cyclic phosphodiesterase